MQHPEAREQERVVQWLRMKYPLILFTGGFDAAKLRPEQGARRKRSGYLAGTPDILIFEPRGIYHALFVEMKAPERVVVSESQDRFLCAAQERGYKTVVCAGAEQAMIVITEYFKGLKK